MLEFAAPIVSLHIGADRYDLLVGARLKSARVVADWTIERLAVGLTDVLGTAINASEIEDWEEGRSAFRAGILPAALDLMGISEAELVGLSNPDAVEVTRLAAAVVKVRGLLNDPVALMHRASELLEGAAQPLLVLAVTVASLIRTFGAPTTRAGAALAVMAVLTQLSQFS